LGITFYAFEIVQYANRGIFALTVLFEMHSIGIEYIVGPEIAYRFVIPELPRWHIPATA
jgi:hypothetical protein